MTTAPGEAPRSAGEKRSPLRATSLLLASHGTQGALAAEAAALAALATGGRLHHLVIVPELWLGMTGDGWRINASTEHAFCDYVEGQIEREILEHLHRVDAAARARGIAYSASSEVGPLAEQLIKVANAGDYDLVMIGAPRPKGTPGLRSRMDLDKLARGLSVPLVIIRAEPCSARAT